MKFLSTCCGTARQQLEYHCEQHGHDCPDQVLKYHPEREDDPSGIPPRSAWFSLIAPNATYKATWCPFCGKDLFDNCKPVLEDKVERKCSPKTIEPETCEIYFGGEWMGFYNQYEFNDLRLQIKETKEPGWRVVFNGNSVDIDTDGRIDWQKVPGLFELYDKQLFGLF